jgi:hypothetical protein
MTITVIAVDADERLSSVGLADDAARLHAYLRDHPPADPHLAILLQSLICALSAFAVQATREACECLDDLEDDEPRELRPVERIN